MQPRQHKAPRLKRLMANDDGGLKPPVIEDELRITMELLGQQHKQNMEMIDKILQLKRLQMGIKEEIGNEIPTDTTTDAEC